MPKVGKFTLHNDSTLAHARIERALDKMPDAMRLRTLDRMAWMFGTAMGVEFRLNEREHDEGIRLHPLERAKAHREAGR